MKPTEHEMERKLLLEFEQRSELTPLSMLADWVDEFDEGRKHFSTLLREVAAAANPAIHWFYANGGPSYFPEFETVGQGRLRHAAMLAWNEAEYYKRLSQHRADTRWRFRWVEDVEATTSVFRENPVTPEEEQDQEPSVLWMCILEEYRVLARGSDWRHLDSLGAIDLGDGLPLTVFGIGGGTYLEPAHMLKAGWPPYCRVVQAELAEDNIDNNPPHWIEPESALRVEVVVPRRLVHRTRKGNEVREVDDGELFLVIPCSPVAYSIISTEFDEQDLCEAYMVDRHGNLVDTAVTYRGFLRSTRSAERTEPEVVLAMQKLAALNIVGVYADRAPDNYLKTMRERRMKARLSGIFGDGM